MLADQSTEVKRANFAVRTLWTLIMIGGFFACFAAGPLFVILLVVLVQGLVYKEVIYLANVPSREKKLPLFRTMNWYVRIQESDSSVQIAYAVARPLTFFPHLYYVM